MPHPVRHAEKASPWRIPSLSGSDSGGLGCRSSCVWEHRGSGVGFPAQTWNSGLLTWQPRPSQAFPGGGRWRGWMKQFVGDRELSALSEPLAPTYLKSDSQTYQGSVWLAKRGSPVSLPFVAPRLLHSRRGCYPAGPRLRPRPGRGTSPIDSGPPLLGDKGGCVTGSRCDLAINVMLEVWASAAGGYVWSIGARWAVRGGAWPLRVGQGLPVGPVLVPPVAVCFSVLSRGEHVVDGRLIECWELLVLAVGAWIEITQYATVVGLGIDSPSLVRRRHLHQATASASVPCQIDSGACLWGRVLGAWQCARTTGASENPNSAHYFDPNIFGYLAGMLLNRRGRLKASIFFSVCCLYSMNPGQKLRVVGRRQETE